MSKTILDFAKVVDSLHQTPEYQENGYPMVRIVDVNDDFLDLSACLKVSKENLLEHNKNHTPKQGDIIITRVGSFGMLGYVDTNETFCLGQNIAIISPYTNSRFLYYYLRSPYIQSIIHGNSGGSSYKCISLEEIRKLPVEIDGLNCKQIGEILYSIDSKIQINRKICAELETMAKTIYDYWFTQFDFPDADGKPYRSSGGAMEWNSNIGRALPKDWEVHYLSEIFETKLGGTPDTKEESFWNGDIPWLSSGEVAQSPILSSEKTITSQGMKCSSTSFAEKGTVVLSITRYIRPAILGIDACFNQSVVAIVPNKKYRTEYLYQVILAQVDRYMTLRSGAQQPHINKEIVDKTLVICPPSEILQKYYDVVEPLYSTHMNAAKENCELTKLRDWLLPMLMNGQAKVK